LPFSNDRTKFLGHHVAHWILNYKRSWAHTATNQVNRNCVWSALIILHK